MTDTDEIRNAAEAAMAATGVEYGRARELMQALCTPAAILALLDSLASTFSLAIRSEAECIDAKLEHAAAEAALSASQEEVKRLREALEPFVTASTRLLEVQARVPDDFPLVRVLELRLGDLRRAREALKDTP